jgi:hypothetical protein
MMQKELQAKKDYAQVGEEISHELAAEFILAYDKAYPDDIKWFCMGKNILSEILSQPGCAGIRFYNGINEKGQKTLVYVGVDAEGKDIVTKTVVQEDGSIATVKATVADRNEGGFDFWTWLFGG